MLTFDYSFTDPFSSKPKLENQFEDDPALKDLLQRIVGKEVEFRCLHVSLILLLLQFLLQRFLLFCFLFLFPFPFFFFPYRSCISLRVHLEELFTFSHSLIIFKKSYHSNIAPRRYICRSLCFWTKSCYRCLRTWRRSGSKPSIPPRVECLGKLYAILYVS